jgi:hypothetical protein
MNKETNVFNINNLDAQPDKSGSARKTLSRQLERRRELISSTYTLAALFVVLSGLLMIFGVL